MNTQDTLHVSQTLRDATDIIFEKFREMQRSEFDIFFQLLSTTIFQSPSELALTWIKKFVPEEWSLFQESPLDSMEIRELKYKFRANAVLIIYPHLSSLGNYPHLTQKMTTRLLVRKVLAQSLPVHDQDRFLALQHFVNYKVWKSLLVTLSQYNLISDEIQLSRMPGFIMNGAGEFDCIIRLDGGLALPNVITCASKLLEQGMISSPRELEITPFDHANVRFILPSEVLRRYRDMIGISLKEQQVRHQIFSLFGGFPVYKKQVFGNSSSEVDPEGKWKMMRG